MRASIAGAGCHGEADRGHRSIRIAHHLHGRGALVAADSAESLAFCGPACSSCFGVCPVSRHRRACRLAESVEFPDGIYPVGTVCDDLTNDDSARDFRQREVGPITRLGIEIGDLRIILLDKKLRVVCTRTILLVEEEE